LDGFFESLEQNSCVDVGSSRLPINGDDTPDELVVVLEDCPWEIAVEHLTSAALHTDAPWSSLPSPLGEHQSVEHLALTEATKLHGILDVPKVGHHPRTAEQVLRLVGVELLHRWSLAVPPVSQGCLRQLVLEIARVDPGNR